MLNFHNLKVRDEMMESVLLMNKSSREVSCCVVDDEEIEIEYECEIESEYEIECECEYEYEIESECEIECECEIESEYEIEFFGFEIVYECSSCGMIKEKIDELCCF